MVVAPVRVAGDVLRLPRPDSALELDYDLLTGEKEGDNRYRVSLVDGDGETLGWTATNSHRYARLRAGSPRFRVLNQWVRNQSAVGNWIHV